LLLRDVLKLRLAGRMCVLSACSTAQPGTRLPDEVVSLPTGLLQAGYTGVLATQWPVHGEVSACLAGCFYRSWQEDGSDPAAALAAAQEWLCTTTNAEKLADLAAWFPDGAFGSVRRALRLRPPLARSFAQSVHWAAFSYHGR
jgi:CHAT domain-containing protein